MSRKLMVRYEQQMKWWMDYEDRHLCVKIDGEWRNDNNPFSGYSPEQIELIEDIVIGDIFKKYRMAESDGNIILRSCRGEWKPQEQPISYHGNTGDYAIKPFPEWVKEATYEKPVVCMCKNYKGNKDTVIAGIIEFNPSSDKPFTAERESWAFADPVSTEQLHDFQKKDVITISEIENHAYSSHETVGTACKDILENMRKLKAEKDA